MTETFKRPIAGSVLVVWEHGGQLGHIARLIPIVSAVCARGHAVVVATPEPAVVAPFFKVAGVSFVTAPKVAWQPSARATLICPADILLHCGFANPSAAQTCVLQWFALFDRLKPSAVLVDASPIAQYAANAAGLDVVLLGHGFELPPPSPGLSFAPWLEGTNDTVAASEEQLVIALSALGKLLKHENAGLSLDRLLGDPGDPSCTQGILKRALCVWPELDHFERALPDTAYVGPIWHTLPGAGASAAAVTWPDKAGPKVLCYLTLLDNRHDFLWQALQEQQTNVVVVSPGGLPSVCDAARSWGISVCTHAVDLDALVPACDAVVSSGGMGLTSMALHAGKPLMLLPTQLEQALLAYQLVRKGLVISTMRHQHPLQVRARVEQLLHDAGLKLRAARFASSYAWFKPQMAVDKVAHMLLGNTEHTSVATN